MFLTACSEDGRKSLDLAQNVGKKRSTVGFGNHHVAVTRTAILNVKHVGTPGGSMGRTHKVKREEIWMS